MDFHLIYSYSTKYTVAALTVYLETAKAHNYGTATNWLELNQLAVAEANVTADFSKDGVTDGIKGIYNKLVADNRSDENCKVTGADGEKKEAIAYAIDSYAMNTFARYLGAFGHATDSPVKTVIFDNVEYTWQEKPGGGYFAGSKWKDAEGNTLVSMVVTEQKTSIREVSLKIVDAKENSITVTFKANNVPTKDDMKTILDLNVESEKTLETDIEAENTVETNLENKGEVGQE